MTGVVTLLALLVVVSACAGPRSTADLSPELQASYVPSDAEARIRTVVDAWGGTPYVYGGVNRDGLDCSAFMQVVYRNVFQFDLPRSTALQVNAGHRVSRPQLRAGDLVFFRPSSKQRHVGVYLSRGNFAHVSSSAGVTISNMDEDYWQRAYWTARRIVGEAPVAEGRTGW